MKHTRIQKVPAALAREEAPRLLSSAPSAPGIKPSEVEFSTRDYEMAYGHAPKGRGSWAFYFADDPRTPWFAPGSRPYSEARKLACAEAQRRGVIRVSVGS